MGRLVLKSRHRLLCGDSTNAEHVATLMCGAKADLCFTSPPYGLQRDYTAESRGKLDDWDGWNALMRGVFANLPMADAGQVLVNLGMIHRDGEWLPYWDGWIEWMRDQGWRRFGWYVWDQGPGLPGDWSGRLAPSTKRGRRGQGSSRGTFPFSGSGTTLIAAEQLNRRCFAMEISPQYCDVAVHRFDKMTGEKAVRWEN